MRIVSERDWAVIWREPSPINRIVRPEKVLWEERGEGGVGEEKAIKAAG